MVALTLILPALLTGQGTVSLRYMPLLNHPYHYRMTMQMKMAMGPAGTQEMTNGMDLEMKAVSRKGDVTTIEARTSHAKVTAPAGSPFGANTKQIEKGMNAAPPVRVSIDSLGNVKSGVGGRMGFQGLRYPTHPVRVGDTWSASLDLAQLSGMASPGLGVGGKLPMKFKLVAINGSGAGRVAQVSISTSGTITMNPNGQKISTLVVGKGMMTIEVATGMGRNSNMVIDSTTSFGKQSMKNHMVQTMKLK